jgi:hypothetical protein
VGKVGSDRSPAAGSEEAAAGCRADAKAGLVRILKRKLKKIQYRSHLIDGCLTATGLRIEPW